MIVTLERAADTDKVRAELAGLGLWVIPYRDDGGGVCYLVEAHSGAVTRERLAEIAGVASVAAPPSTHPLVDVQEATIEIAGRRIGAGEPTRLMAGPCSIESPEQIHTIAERIASEGATFLRGGAFKPRSSPYAFQGHGEQALGWIREAANAHSLKVVTEALGETTVDAVARHADLIQIGSRNMHNTSLLRAVAQTAKPVLLKRGMAATVEEWLLSGEYLLLHGAASVLFCERGIRGFDGQTRNLLDLSAVALLSHVHGLSVIVDPSHALGRRDLIVPLSRAALGAGAAGVLVETHDDPAAAFSDGPQALPPEAFHDLACAVVGPSSPALFE